MRIFLASILALSIIAHVVMVEKFTDEIIKIGDKDCSCSFVFKVKKNMVSRKQSKVSCQDNCKGTSELIQLTSQDTGTTYEFKVKARKGKDVLIKPRITVQIDDELFEGDMLLTQEQLQKLKESLISGSLEGVKPMKKPKTNACVNVDERWPDKTVYYQLNLDNDRNDIVRNTLNNLQRKIERYQGSGSCVKFVEKDSGPRVKVVDEYEVDYCRSRVGYLGYTYKLNLGSWCMRTATIEHEFLHALGIKHEQSRWDRDDYVEILEENIKPGEGGNFAKFESTAVTHYGLPYDYYSVMHYGGKYSSKNDKITIKTLDPSKQNVIGQRFGVSDLDIEVVRRMYDCGIVPLDIKMSSVWKINYQGLKELSGSLCNDDNLETICHTKGGETWPWVAVEIPRSNVQKVKITNRRNCCGERTKNMKIWVGDHLPTTADIEYSGGLLFGTFDGPGTNGEVIERTFEEGLVGNFVIIQMATSEINLAEIEVYGVPAPGITPVDIKMSSVWKGKYLNYTELTGSLCHDNNLVTICHTKGGETWPWVAVKIPGINVQKVKITNRGDCCGERTKNMKIWVGDHLPTTTDTEYSGGMILGTFDGPGTNGEVIERTSEKGLVGNFVIVQMATSEINLAEIAVFSVPAAVVGFGGPNDWDYCNASAPCTLEQGDCDTDEDCSGSLVCGSNNCRFFTAQAHKNADCCFDLELGHP